MSKLQTVVGETRSECIFRYVRRLTRETRTSVEDYSEAVLQVWVARTPEAARGGDFRDSGSIFERMQGNGKKIRRWMSAEVSARPSVDVEESLVLALPEPYRGECQRELSLRLGGIFVPLMDDAGMGLSHVGDLVRECGEALAALAPLFADGKLDAGDDAAALLKARGELLDVESQVHALLGRIDGALRQQARPALHDVRRSA